MFPNYRLTWHTTLHMSYFSCDKKLSIGVIIFLKVDQFPYKRKIKEMYLKYTPVPEYAKEA